MREVVVVINSLQAHRGLRGPWHLHRHDLVISCPEKTALADEAPGDGDSGGGVEWWGHLSV